MTDLATLMQPVAEMLLGEPNQGLSSKTELRYDLRLTHARHELAGTERIAFRNPFSRPLDHVWIRAWDNAFGSCARPRPGPAQPSRVGLRRARRRSRMVDRPSSRCPVRTR